MGRFVARRTLGLPPEFASIAAFDSSRQQFLNDYTPHRFANEIAADFKLLYLTDGSNIGSDFKASLPVSHLFKHDRAENALCGTTGAMGTPNEFLISDVEYEDFELMFWVKLPAGLNSGMQVRSAMLDSDIAKLYGPQIEIDNADFGAIYSEATGAGWLLPPASRTNVSAANWITGDWNAFKIRVVADEYQVVVNDQLVAQLTYTFDKAAWSSLANAVSVKRVGFQVHAPYNAGQPGERVCFKHVLIKRLP
jgi:hypothetical protein